VQVPDAKEDVLAAAVLDQAGPASLPPGTEQLLAALPKHFPITVSIMPAAAKCRQAAPAYDSLGYVAGRGRTTATANAVVADAGHACIGMYVYNLAAAFNCNTGSAALLWFHQQLKLQPIPART
jgi:hypothetical protein